MAAIPAETHKPTTSGHLLRAGETVHASQRGWAKPHFGQMMNAEREASGTESELALLIRQLEDLEDSLQSLGPVVDLGEVPIHGYGHQGFAASFDLDGLYPC